MKLDLVKPIVREKAQELIAKCRQEDIILGITSTYRSNAEQDALYAQGRTKSGPIVTNARAGQSFHNWRVAFDVVELRDGIPNWNCDWLKIGKLGESCGLEWGGRWASFPDKPHFQYTAGYTLADFQNGKIDESKFDLADKQSLLAQISYLKGVLANLLAQLKKKKNGN